MFSSSQTEKNFVILKPLRLLYGLNLGVVGTQLILSTYIQISASNASLQYLSSIANPNLI